MVTGYFVLYGCMSSTQKLVAILLHHRCVRWVSHERREYNVSAAMAVCQPGENKHVCMWIVLSVMLGLCAVCRDSWKN